MASTGAIKLAGLVCMVAFIPLAVLGTMYPLISLTVCSLLVSLLLGFLTYASTKKIPEGLTEPWKVKITKASGDVMFMLGHLGAQLGLWPQYKVDRYVYEFSTKVLPGPDLEGIEVTDTSFNGVPVRIYDPARRGDNSGALIYIHGGGWLVGSIACYHHNVAYLTRKTNLLVVSIEYRMAPEHPFPAPLDDCVTATKHLIENAGKSRIDPKRVVVTGDSAGGQLSATVFLRLNEEKFTPKPKALALIYPVTQALDLDTPSYREKDDYGLSTLMMAAFHNVHLTGEFSLIPTFMENKHVSSELWDKYSHMTDRNLLPKDLRGPVAPERKQPGKSHGPTGKLDELVANKFASPLFADDLSCFPPTLVLTVECDVLRDDGFFFARRLDEAGVNVMHVHRKNAFHGIIYPYCDMGMKEAFQLLDEVVQFTKEQLEQ